MADRERGDKKSMLVTFFSTSGFKVVRFLPIGTTIDSHYCCELFRELARNTCPPLWVHMDNARPHRAKCTALVLEELEIVPLPHPPYSPDLAPSDFWLFGRLKGSLGSTRFSTLEELEKKLNEELHKITTAEIRRVYNEWVRRLQACIESGGEYVRNTQ